MKSFMRQKVIHGSGKLIVYWSSYDEFDKARFKELNAGDKFHVPVGIRHRMVFPSF